MESFLWDPLLVCPWERGCVKKQCNIFANSTTTGGEGERTTDYSDTELELKLKEDTARRKLGGNTEKYKFDSRKRERESREKILGDNG